MRGTLEQLNQNALTVKTRNGTITTIQLKDAAHIVAVTKGAMSDIKENSFVGIAATPQPDGTGKAIEVSVFAEPLRGTAEGHYPWDLMPNSTMTNAAVTHQVEKQKGNTLTLKYKDGEKTIVVPADATIVNLIPGDKSDLKPGAKVFIPVKNTDGCLRESADTSTRRRNRYIAASRKPLSSATHSCNRKCGATTNLTSAPPSKRRLLLRDCDLVRVSSTR